MNNLQNIFLSGPATCGLLESTKRSFLNAIARGAYAFIIKKSKLLTFFSAISNYGKSNEGVRKQTPDHIRRRASSTKPSAMLDL